MLLLLVWAHFDMRRHMKQANKVDCELIPIKHMILASEPGCKKQLLHRDFSSDVPEHAVFHNKHSLCTLMRAFTPRCIRCCDESHKECKTHNDCKICECQRDEEDKSCNTIGLLKGTAVDKADKVHERFEVVDQKLTECIAQRGGVVMHRVHSFTFHLHLQMTFMCFKVNVTWEFHNFQTKEGSCVKVWSGIRACLPGFQGSVHQSVRRVRVRRSLGVSPESVRRLFHTMSDRSTSSATDRLKVPSPLFLFSCSPFKCIIKVMKNALVVAKVILTLLLMSILPRFSDAWGSTQLTDSTYSVLKIDTSAGSSTQFAETYSGSSLYDSCVWTGTYAFCAPYSADKVLKIDPTSTGTSTQLAETYSGSTLYASCFSAISGVFSTHVFCAPYSADKVLKIDLGTGSSTQLTETYSGSNLYASCVLVAENLSSTMWCAPYSADKVLKINTYAGSSNQLTETYSGTDQYKSCVAVGPYASATVWCAPYSADKVLKIDTSADSSTQLAETYSGSNLYASCVLGSSNNVWCAPYSADKVLKIDTSAGSSTQLTDSTYSGSNLYASCVLGSSNNVWCAPYSADKVLKIDTSAGSSTQLTDSTYSGTDQYKACVRRGNYVWCAPYSADKVLKIDTRPPTSSPTSSPTNSPATNSPTNSPATNSPATNSPATNSPTTNSPTTNSPTAAAKGEKLSSGVIAAVAVCSFVVGVCVAFSVWKFLCSAGARRGNPAAVPNTSTANVSMGNAAI
eukprot:jgi/Bigna1/91976/estExt_fgenesh1_pg.C_1410009